ncbi:ATP-binding protein [Streptomyces palmae]|nr:ATP-binding protein [Streptomyces palmae]
MNPGSDEHGREDRTRPTGGTPPLPPRDLAPSPGVARTATLVVGEDLLTVNPVDGSEIEPCPPGARPARPERHIPARRTEVRRAAIAPPPIGPEHELPMLGRAEEREQLSGLLSRGRSVRLTGPSGAGRSTLLAAVAADCEGLAPDGVIQLNGRHRTPSDLLRDLYAAVYHAPRYRAGRAELLAAVREIGAVVVLDDLEFGGAALDDLLDATPECAFLISATPQTAAPSPGCPLEEVSLGGLSRTASLELLERAAGRPLDQEEADWGADLWFESEGLPLRFVQAGALLRQRDTPRHPPIAFDSYGDLAEHSTGAAAEDAGSGAPDRPELPPLTEAAAPAALLAAGLGEAAREALRFAVALGGECPHPSQLPALTGDTRADTALGELAGCGLITPAGPRYRLAAGALAQLTEAGYADTAAAHIQTIAGHYAWWTGHPSVTEERVALEADAVLATLAALLAERAAGQPSTAVLLARTAAPAFASALAWGAWERTLRHGQEAARLAGEVAEEAYFHHELGVLALCTGNLDRARAELEASIGLRGVLADRRGAVAGRRALALVADRSGTAAPSAPPAAGRPGEGAGASPFAPRVPDAGPATAITEQLPPVPSAPDTQLSGTSFPGTPFPGTPPVADQGALPTDRTEVLAPVPPPAFPAPGNGPKRRRGLPWAVLTGSRRNVAAAGAGALLVAVLGTVVTLGMASDEEDGTSPDTVRPGTSSSQPDGTGDPVDTPSSDSGSPDGITQPGTGATSDPTTSPSTGETGSDSESPRTPDDPEATDTPSEQDTTKDPTPHTRPPTTKPTTQQPTTKPPTTKPTTQQPTTPPATSTTTPEDPSPTSELTDSASGPAPTGATTGSYSAGGSAA